MSLSAEHFKFMPMPALFLFGLILARIIPIIIFCPFIGGRMILNPVKIGFGILFSAFLFPLIIIHTEMILHFDAFFALAMLIKEVILGSLIGFAGALPFYAFESAGCFVDIQRNANIANVLIPQIGEQGSLLGDFYFQFSIVLFLVLNGHHYFLSAFFESFLLMPVYSIPAIFSPSLDDTLFITYAAQLFTIALQLSAPVLITLFLVDIVMGLINRISPYFNVFFYAMPIKAMVGLLLVFLAFGYTAKNMKFIFANMLNMIKALIASFAT